MTLEIIPGNERAEAEGLFSSDVVRETTNEGQIIWLKSSPKAESTSSPESQSLKV